MKIYLFFLLLTLYACSNIEQEQNARIFRYNSSTGISSLDPAFSTIIENVWACNHLYNGLVQMDDNLNIIPSISSSWEITPNGKTYTFHLRNDVYFHDNKLFKDGKGRKVVASDFVYSFNRIIDAKIASPGAWIFNNIDACEENNYQPFEAVNDSTLKIYLKKAFPPFLGILTMQYCVVVPHEIVDYYKNDYRSNPIGTGPFKFKVWNENNKLVLLKNDNYFEKDDQGNQLPYIDAVSISFVKDKEMEFLKFLKGDLEFVSGRDGDNKKNIFTTEGVLKKEFESSIDMLTSPYLNTEYLGILIDGNIPIVTQSPLRNKLVRQAINYGFDRKKMIAHLRKNIGTPAFAGIIPKGLPSYNEEVVKGYNYNPEKAKELLRLAGYSERKKMPKITLYTTADYVDLCEYIQHQLGEIGISTNVDVLDQSAHKEFVAQSKLNFFRKSWVADYPDAENYLALFYSKNFTPRGPNYTHFKSPKFDRLYELSQTETNDSIRYTYYQKMDNIMMEEAPIVPLYYDVVVRLTQKDVHNLGINPINLLSLKKVSIDR